MGIWASTHGEFIMKQRMRLEEANPGLAEEQAACMYIVTSTIQILMLSFAALGTHCLLTLPLYSD